MKKFLFGTFLGIFALAGVAVLPNYASADENDTNPGFADADAVGWNSQATSYNAGVAGASDFQGDSLLKTIKKAINWVLGILSTIALVLCLRGGFKMMTSGGDQKKYEDGLNVLKWAAIGLAVIACSWLIVSLIFYVINGSTNAATN